VAVDYRRTWLVRATGVGRMEDLFADVPPAFRFPKLIAFFAERAIAGAADFPHTGLPAALAEGCTSRETLIRCDDSFRSAEHGPPP